MDRLRNSVSQQRSEIQYPHTLARRLLPYRGVLEIRGIEAAGTLEDSLFVGSGKVQEGTCEYQKARTIGAEEMDILGCLELHGRPDRTEMGNTPLCQDLQRQDADRNLFLGSKYDLHRRRTDLSSHRSIESLCRAHRGVYRNRRRHHTRMLGISGSSLFDSHGSRTESRELLLLLHGRRHDSGYFHIRTLRYSLRIRRRHQNGSSRSYGSSRRYAALGNLRVIPQSHGRYGLAIIHKSVRYYRISL